MGTDRLAVMLLVAYMVTFLPTDRLDAIEASMETDLQANTPGADVALGELRSMRRRCRREKIPEGRE